MIQPQELRLGNYVNQGIEQIKIDSIEFEDVSGYWIIYYNDFSDSKVLADCEPIPLTEEWLIRLGFSKMITQENTYLMAIGVEFALDSIDILFKIDTGMLYKGTLEDPVLFPINHIKIEFAHHLQNAVFENFREELTIIR